MYIAWTTCSKVEEAEQLAKDAILNGLAACAQLETITSFYLWDKSLEYSPEYRLCFKCSKTQLKALESFILGKHSYKVPEWIALEVTHTSEKYLSWVQASSTA
jgi:periplasmic divalent cation tolerance protein